MTKTNVIPLTTNSAYSQLNEKQRMAVDAYFETGSINAACRAAGYADKRSWFRSDKLLRAVAERARAVSKAMDIDKDWLVVRAVQILEDDATRPADKLKAISQISRLLGLETQQIDMAVSSADDINARAWQAVRARLGLPDRNRNTGELA